MKDVKPNVDLDDKYLHEIDSVTFNPVFILGVERSGTSILYKLLNATNCFNSVMVYHILKYPEILYNHINNLEMKSKADLSDFFKKNFQADRGIDQLQITPDFPEEYRFILGQKTGHDILNPKTLDFFTELCKKIQYISKDDKPILLKNPPDFSNFLYIKSVFPNAKFIFIHRNPLKTLNSQLNAMNTLLQKKSFYMAILSPWYNKVFDHKIRLRYYQFLYSKDNPIRVISAVNKLKKSTDHFLQNISYLKKDKDYIDIRYETLCNDPGAVILDIMRFLDLQISLVIDYNDFIKPRKTSFLNEIDKRKNPILKKMSEYISYCRYSEEGYAAFGEK